MQPRPFVHVLSLLLSALTLSSCPEPPQGFAPWRFMNWGDAVITQRRLGCHPSAILGYPNLFFMTNYSKGFRVQS